MATYRNFTDVPGLQVEIEDNGAAATDPSLAGLLDGLSAVVTQAADQLGQLPAGQRPTELSLTFGLRAVSGGFAIGLDVGATNFRVSLVWSQEPAVPEPEVPAFPGL
ncbi:CU044_2847 family protein [Nonomuraea africana]|uniref:CU044_2847 family protein n=1 Tax=Nonomuraea africana TaxID=46171 RepID=UPI0033DB6AF0